MHRARPQVLAGPPRQAGAQIVASEPPRTPAPLKIGPWPSPKCWVSGCFSNRINALQRSLALSHSRTSDTLSTCETVPDFLINTQPRLRKLFGLEAIAVSTYFALNKGSLSWRSRETY
jgi:hypothetical protein